MNPGDQIERRASRECHGQLHVDCQHNGQQKTWTTAAFGQSNCNGQPHTTTNNGTVVVGSVSPTSLSVDAASGTYGGSVDLSATLTSSGMGVSGKTVDFTLNGSPVGSAVSDGSDVASLSGVSLAGIGAGSYLAPAQGVGASFAGDVDHDASNGGNALTVAKAVAVIESCLRARHPDSRRHDHCTVTVRDTESAGAKAPPTGMVTVTAYGSNAPAAGTCGLAAVDAESSSCSRAFTSSVSEVWSIGADYDGSVVHGGSDVHEKDRALMVFYDPESGHVTGGGWINSPVRPAAEFMQVGGRANFGFVAQVGFMLTVIDGSPDRFRIKIWNKANNVVVYDNELGAGDETNPTTAIGGGSIVIHNPTPRR